MNVYNVKKSIYFLFFFPLFFGNCIYLGDARQVSKIEAAGPERDGADRARLKLRAWERGTFSLSERRTGTFVISDLDVVDL